MRRAPSPVPSFLVEFPAFLVRSGAGDERKGKENFYRDDVFKPTLGIPKLGTSFKLSHTGFPWQGRAGIQNYPAENSRKSRKKHQEGQEQSQGGEQSREDPAQSKTWEKSEVLVVFRPGLNFFPHRLDAFGLSCTWICSGNALPGWETRLLSSGSAKGTWKWNFLGIRMRGICWCAHLGAPCTGYRQGFPCSDRSQQGNPCKHELLVIKCPLNISLNKYLIDSFAVLSNFSAVSTLLPRRLQHPGPPKNPQNQENRFYTNFYTDFLPRAGTWRFKFPLSLQIPFIPSPKGALPPLCAAQHCGSSSSSKPRIPNLARPLNPRALEATAGLTG